MEELVKSISALMSEVDKDMAMNVTGNKSAGRRARKNTLALEKMFKQYRKMSVESEK